MLDPLISLLVAALIAGVGLLLFWPERGLYWRWQRARQMTERILREDALKHIHHCQMYGRRPTVQSIAGALHITIDEAADLLVIMEAHELLRVEGEVFHLTPQGRDYALHIIRAHRLWERYLADETGFVEAEWHGQADRQEHNLSPAEADALAAQLGHPTYDPHGDPIPTASGELVSHGGQSLTTIAIDQPARIVHLEDEPEAVYAQLVAEGLHPGLEVRLTQVLPQRIRFWAAGDEHILAPIVAANISVIPIRQEEKIGTDSFEPLSNLKSGQTARVVGISHTSWGAERRRFMDLGILPGTLIKAEMVSPSGDPTAYRIRGALIGLRKEQAALINITCDLIPTLDQAPKMEATL
jgi:DtxR family Mn-dependent transcriptional regulator